MVAHVHSRRGLSRRETFYHGAAGRHNSNGATLAPDRHHHRRQGGGDLGSHASEATLGLKALRKESREKLDAYQNLFYLLQTNPSYLAKLVFVMPQLRTTKFLESVILSLYNFGSNQREEYLLLGLGRNNRSNRTGSGEIFIIF